MYCNNCGCYIGSNDTFCARCGTDSGFADQPDQNNNIEFQLQPLAGRGGSRIISIPVRLFLGTLALLGIVFVSVLGYVCYQVGLFPF